MLDTNSNGIPPRERRILRTGCIQLFLWHVTAGKAAPSHPAEQVHVWHEKSQVRNYWYFTGFGMDGSLEGFPVIRYGQWFVQNCSIL